jgi:hypothetical protein
MPAKREDIWDDPDLPSEKATAINRQRMATYGTPVPNMEMFADLISPIVYPNEPDRKVTPTQAAIMNERTTCRCIRASCRRMAIQFVYRAQTWVFRGKWKHGPSARAV